MGEALGGTYAKADMGCKREGNDTIRDENKRPGIGARA